MDVAASESELVRSLHPTDIVADVRIRPSEIRIDDGGTPTNVEAISSSARSDRRTSCTHISSRDCNTWFRVGIERSIHAQLGPDGKTVRYLGNFLPVGSDTEGINDISADQIGASDRKRIHPIGLTVPVQCQATRPIKCCRNIQIRDEESSEYGVLLARLPIKPRNFHVLALIASQSEVHFAAWVTR